MKDASIKNLVGETLAFIDVDEQLSTIRLTTASGRVFMIHHEQDCCEYVRIVDTQGQWRSLIGKVVVEADEVIRCGQGCFPPEVQDSESWTETVLTFRVDNYTVVTRWIGESNGYYSESVDVSEITETL